MKDYSYGVLALRHEEAGWNVLLVKSRNGYWGFPKGHKESGESDEEAAKRELKEETGLDVKVFFALPALSESYQFFWEDQRIEKEVRYFLAEVKGELQVCLREILEARWLSFNEAEALATFPEAKKICVTLKELEPRLPVSNDRT